MKKLFLYLLALPLTFMSCSDDSSEDFIEENQVFEKISYTSDYQQLQTYQTVIINSEKEYQDFVSKYIDDISNQTPKRSKVNFSKKSIIMVYGASNKGIDDIERKLEKHDNDYYIDITVMQDLTYPIMGWYVGYTVPKITNEKVNVNVRYE